MAPMPSIGALADPVGDSTSILGRRRDSFAVEREEESLTISHFGIIATWEDELLEASAGLIGRDHNDLVVDDNVHQGRCRNEFQTVYSQSMRLHSINRCLQNKTLSLVLELAKRFQMGVRAPSSDKASVLKLCPSGVSSNYSCPRFAGTPASTDRCSQQSVSIARLGLVG